MSETDLREKLKAEVQATHAPELLPHHRREALLIVTPAVDLLDAAMAIAEDNANVVAELLEAGSLYKPTLADLADWCVDTELRFQFVILQPYVLAQPIASEPSKSDTSKN